MNETKQHKSVEQSLGYIAWDLKNLVKEIQKLNETLEKIASKQKDLF